MSDAKYNIFGRLSPSLSYGQVPYKTQDETWMVFPYNSKIWAIFYHRVSHHMFKNIFKKFQQPAMQMWVLKNSHKNEANSLTSFFKLLWGSPWVLFKASVIAVTKLEAEKPVVSLSCEPFNMSTCIHQNSEERGDRQKYNSHNMLNRQ